MIDGRERLVAIAERNLAHHRAGTVDQADGVVAVPARHYVDPDRYALEVERIFRRLPLVAGLSAELPGPGAYKALELCGMPVLVVRGDDGGLRAFVDMCSHRGSVLVGSGCGVARRFTCPYHAWSYDLDGTLRGVLDREQFGEFDIGAHGLTSLAVEERCGLVFVSITPGRPLGLDAFLAGYEAQLAPLRLAEGTVVGSNTIAGPNWKVAYDGYLDFYHLPVLHRQSFGPDISNKASYDAWGPHQRVSSPGPEAERYVDRPAAEWPNGLLTSGVITVFPHVSIATFDAGGPVVMVSQLLPGPDVASSTTVQHFVARGVVDDARRPVLDRTMAFLHGVVRDEDYATGLRQQRALATGAKDHVLFGRNEAGGQRFHRWVDALVAAPDDDALAAVFRDGSPS